MRTVREIQDDIKEAHNADDFKQMLHLCDELADIDDPKARVSEYRTRAIVAAYAGETEEAAVLYERSIDAANESGDVIGEARSRINYAYTLMRTGSLNEAYVHFEQALDLAEEKQDLDVIEMATAGLGMVRSNQGRPHEAIAHHEKALEISRKMNNGPGISSCLGNIAIVYAIQRDFPNALRFFEQARAQYQADGDESGDANIVFNIGVLYQNAANLVEAVNKVQEAYDVHERLGLHAAAIRIKIALGTMYSELDNAESAAKHLEEVIEPLEKIGDKIGLAQVWGNLGSVASRRGDLEEAMRYSQQALELHAEAGAFQEVVTQRILLAQIALANDDLESATEQVRLASEIEELPSGPKIRLAVMNGRVLIESGQTENGVAELKQALELAEDTDFKTEIVHINELLRDQARSAGDLEGYITYNDVCTKLAEEIRGKDVGVQVAMQKVEREAAAERQEREKERALLYGALPESVAKRMIAGEDVSGDHFDHASVMFLDVAGFTSNSDGLEPRVVTELLDDVFNTFDSLCDEHNVMKIKTIGDAYLAVAFPSDEGPSCEERLAGLALGIQKTSFTWPDKSPLQFRVGCHSGPVVAGVIGKQRLQYDVWGDTVNTASRMESSGEPGRVHCSEAFAAACHPEVSLERSDGDPEGSLSNTERDTEGPLSNTERDTIGSSVLRTKDDRAFGFAPRGEIDVKGKGTMTTYWLEGA